MGTLLPTLIMIAFGCVTTDDEEFRSSAAVAIHQISEIWGESLLMRRHRPGSVGSAYNEMLSDAVSYEELEAVVFIDQAATIRGEDFMARVRALLAQGVDIAAIGTVASQEADDGLLAVDGTLAVLSARAARELPFEPDSNASLDAQITHVLEQAGARGSRVIPAREDPRRISQGFRS